MPLNQTGIAQAAAAAELLRGRGIATIASSPLSRAYDTASAAGAVLGLPVKVIEALQEVSFGVNEGLIMGPAWFSAWVAGDYTPEGGESFAALRTRALVAVTEALDHPSPVLVVSHGAFFRALRAEMGLPPDVRIANGVPVFCSPGVSWTLTPAS